MPCAGHRCTGPLGSCHDGDIDYLTALTGAGLLGFDPVGAVVAVGALSLGAGRRGMAALLVSYLATITVLGTGLAVALRYGLGAVHLRHLLHSGRVLTIIELVAGVGLIVAAGILFARRGRPRTGREKRRVPVSPKGLALAGAGVAASLLIDPGFLVLGAVCAPHHPSSYPPAALYWGLWSQVLMVIVCLAVLVDRRGRLTNAERRWVDAVTAHLPTVTTVVLALVGVALLVDGLHRWLSHGLGP